MQFDNHKEMKNPELLLGTLHNIEEKELLARNINTKIYTKIYRFIYNQLVTEMFQKLTVKSNIWWEGRRRQDKRET